MNLLDLTNTTRVCVGAIPLVNLSQIGWIDVIDVIDMFFGC